jgi:glycosyltransferase involved in cell wall biosynthesis
MRILKVVQAYYPFQEKGGPVVKVRALATGLAQRRHEVTVLTADLGIDSYRKQDATFERCEWGWRAKENGVETIYLRTIGKYRALTVNSGVRRFCEASLDRFDLAHFYGLYDLLGPSVSRFCIRRRMPYMIEPMGMYRPIDRSFRLKRLWHQTVGRSFLRNAEKFVATSELERDDLLQQGVPADKVLTRYNGIDASLNNNSSPKGAFRDKWKIPRNQPIILFLSRLIPRKGADVLIEAFAEACPQGRLVIAGPEGEPGYLAYLEECAAKAKVADRTIFTGPLYDDDKQSALVDADLFVLPSRYENFANVAAEAIACDVPVIVTNACGIHSLVEGRAGLVIRPAKAELVKALHDMLSDSHLYARLKQGCRAVAAELDWSQLTEQMECHYMRALNHVGGQNLAGVNAVSVASK